ncbi:tetraspanin-15 [Cornus florida]|uniref:tetraspanin-15 n=1 Tax=Cornus florida TaxID=4283 RepID=UPI0028A191DD|nr:tetraspanin-15 [Cornus florida]
MAAETTNSTDADADAVAVTVTVPEEKSKAKEDSQAMKDKGVQIKHVILPLTTLSFLLSLPILFSVIWLLYMRQCDCEQLLKLPKLQVGIVIGLIFIFLVSNIVVYLRARFPMPGLLLVMVPLIMMLTVGLALAGAYKSESRTIPGSPSWLQMIVHDKNYWNNIKSCIYDTRTCNELVSRSYMLKSYDFSTTKLSPIESGCCKPPTNCGMEYVNATYWRKEDGAADSSNPYDSDCDLWENNNTILCYNCHACKQGFLTTLQGKWGKLGVFLFVMSLLLVISHLLLFVATMWERYGG